MKGEGKILAAHVAATKNHLIIDDVQRDTRFSEGLKWIDAQVAMCVPIVKPNGECGGVIEFYRTFSEPYDNVNYYYCVIYLVKLAMDARVNHMYDCNYFLISMELVTEVESYGAYMYIYCFILML